MALTILRDDEPVLRQKAKPVTRINASIRKLLDEMLVCMRSAPGVGLAAPQVGVSKRIVVVDAGDGVHELINPEILSRDGSETGFEGCLSIPGWIGEVPRACSVRVTGLDREGRQVWLDGTGFLARVLQHEIDHLDGVLFTDKAVSLMEVEPTSDEQAEEREPAVFNIVYMGTPEFSVKPLEALMDAGHTIKLVVTQPDRRGHRGSIEESALKRFAQENGLPIAQPASVKDEGFINQIRAENPDFIVVAAFGQKLPTSLLNVPRHGAINIHASLLPRYRGASPVHMAIMNGETETGVTIMKMASGLDTGDMLAQKAIAIEQGDDTGSLSARISLVGAALLVQVLPGIASGSIKPSPQKNEDATFARTIKADDERLDWTRPAKEIVNKVRALSPEPGARTLYNGKLVKVWKISEVSGMEPERPGSVYVDTSGNLLVSTGDAWVSVTELQPAGKRRMTGIDFSRGYRPKPGDIFE